MRLHALLAAALLLAPLAGPAVAAQAPCSGRSVSADLPAQAGLPAPVARTRAAIARAAADCDVDRLAGLALAGEPPFSFTFGPPEGGPAAFWRQREAEGEPVLATLVQLLKLPYVRMAGGTEPALYTWPSAAGDHPTEQDWRALRPLFPSEAAWKQQVAAYRTTIGAYLGDRVGITATGDWLYFVAGD